VIALFCLEPPRPGRAARTAEILARNLAGVERKVAVSVGGPKSSESLVWVLGRRSFQRIIHVDDSSLEKADYMTLGTVLAEVARHVCASLVIAGEHSDVEGQGLVPAALAHHLRAPLVSRVQAVRLSPSDPERLEVTTRAGGLLRTLEIPSPLVLSVPATACGDVDLAAPNPASSVEEITLAELALDPSRLVPRPELLGSHLPAPSDKPQRMTPDEAARFILRRP
jgi:electron transfer flavoprotein alpha/beta subunit